MSKNRKKKASKKHQKSIKKNRQKIPTNDNDNDALIFKLKRSFELEDGVQFGAGFTQRHLEFEGMLEHTPLGRNDLKKVSVK